MINEELAIKAQQGDKQALQELWTQVEKLMTKLCDNVYKRLTGDFFHSRGVTFQDLTQESYFAYLQAVQAYDPDKGYKFTSYLQNHLKTSVADLTGMRTSRQQGEPLNKCDSLDRPLSSDYENTTIADTIVDGASSIPFDDVEHDIANEQLHDALEQAMKATCNEREQQVVKWYYYDQSTLKECGEVLGVQVERIRQIRNHALRNLRKPQSKRMLEPFNIEMIASGMSTSFNSFKEHGSVEERSLERLEKLKEKLAQTV